MQMALQYGQDAPASACSETLLCGAGSARRASKVLGDGSTSHRSEVRTWSYTGASLRAARRP
jgi:hypothetical protein